MSKKFNTAWIPYILIGVLVIVLYFVWTSKSGEPDENKKIKEAELRIEELEKLLLVKDSILNVLTVERDDALNSVRSKTTADEKNIKIKYVKFKNDIINLSDDSSVKLLNKNLGGK